MPARIVMVDEDWRDAFIAYALVYGREHDESYVEREDLEALDLATEIAALAVDQSDAVVGAASLMLEGYAGEGLARFRILHALDPDAYAGLVEAVTGRLPHGVDRCFVFIPDESPLARTLSELGFIETRRAMVLRREGPLPADLPLPEDIRLRVFDPDRDAEAWAAVSNAGFAGFPDRYDVTPTHAVAFATSERILPGGAVLAWRGAEPVGLLLVACEPDEDGVRVASIDTLAVVPSVQGGGLGRLLLRKGISLALEAGYQAVDLSTNATNDRALALYRSEGFEAVDVRICWTRFAEGDHAECR